LCGIPLLVHEQNRVPGLTNRFLAYFATQVLEAFPGSWPRGQAVVTCGNPVRAALLAVAPPSERWAGRSGPLRLLITGGSQGADALNQALPAALARLPEALLPDICHQAGSGRQAATQAAYTAAGLPARVDEFIDDMAAAYAWADLVVCRSGASTVAELAAVGLGAVLVPFPQAVDDHQTRNAEFLATAGAARLLPQPECTPGNLAAVLAELLATREPLLRMAEAARALAVPDAAERVARLCMQAMRG
jgi:UDP-N-acetylglucosamine--N-acetylmuramyl-(pentapeptide) pyrophosphoryl-undecaprenol N-acetylglucosamine transferase